jgi:hypothetical protein
MLMLMLIDELERKADTRFFHSFFFIQIQTVFFLNQKNVLL